MPFISLLFDPIAGKTLALVSGIYLSVASMILISEFTKSAPDHNLRKRFMSWVVLAFFVLVPLYAGGILFTGLVCLLMLFCERELLEVVQLSRNQVYKWVVYISSIAILAVAFLESAPKGVWYDLFAGRPELAVQSTFPLSGVGPHAFYAVQVFVILLVLVIRVLPGKHQGTFNQQCATIFSVIYVGSFCGYLVLLRDCTNGFGFTLLLFSSTVLNDILAFWFGRLFGRTLLCPSISPKKTVEGAVGGLLGSLIACLLFRYAAPGISLEAVLIAGLLVGVTAPLGDLVASAIKRDMSVKDFGTALPGIGGVLDRCDSLLFSIPAFYYYLVLIGQI